jgi:hypothetical protein
MSVLRLIAKPRRKTAIAEKPRGLAACPGRVPSLSAYAYQSSVSLLLATLALAAYLGHANIQNTKRYARMNAARFDGIWRD